MTEGEAGERAREGDPHPLPELLDSVLNQDKDWARTAGWQVRKSGGVIMIGVYDEPPESGGWVENRAVFKP